MKNRITIKVKHLFIILVSIFILLPLANLFLVPQFDYAYATYKSATGKVVGKDQLLGLLESSIFPYQKHRLVEHHLLNDPWPGDYDIYIGPSMSSSILSTDSPLLSWELKKPYVMDYVENGPANGYLVTAAVELATETARREGEQQVDDIYERVLERLKNTTYTHLLPELGLSFAKIFMQSGNLSKAKSLLERLEIPDEQDYYQSVKIKYEVMILLQQGEREKALAKIQDEDLSMNSEEMSDLVHLLHAESTDLGTISGTISREDGSPVTHAGVILRKASDVNRTGMSDEFYQTTTDEEGHFQLDGVVAGSYQLFTAFQLDQIDGYTWPVDIDDWIYIEGEEITYDITLVPLIEINEPRNETVLLDDEIQFSWEQVVGAAYYTLQFHIEEEGVSYSTGYPLKVNDNQLTLPVESLYNVWSSTITNSEHLEWEHFNPATYLGFEYPDGNYSWSVQAYDETGKLLTRSDGYRLGNNAVGNLPIIQLKQRELTDEDKLLLDGKVEEALDGYLAIVEQNPEDLHSLRMITRLIGIQADGDMYKLDELQLPYMKQLAELTNDPSYLYRMAMFYYGNKDWDHYESWLERYLTVSGDIDDPYFKALHANAYMFQGKYEEAIRLHHTALESGSDHRYIGNLLALEIYLGTELEEVYQLAKRYPYFEASTGNEGLLDWSTLVLQIKREVEKDEQALEVLMEGVQFFFEGNESELENWKERTTVSTFLKFIRTLEYMN